MTRVIRLIINVVIVVLIVSAIAGYKADLVASIFPIAGPYAKSVHDMLPAAIVGAPPPTAAAAPPPRPAVNVVVGHASKKDLPWTISAIGTAQPITSVALRPRYDAMVNAVKIADGAEVKAGDVLIELDSAQLQAMLGVAKAQLAKDQATLEQNKRDVARFTDLVSRNAEPGINLDNAKTAVESTNAAIEGDKAQIQNLQVQIGWAEVVAPISGRVGVVNIKQGNIAKSGDNSAAGILATINQISPIYVSFSLAQSLLPSIRQAMAANAKVTARPQGSTKVATGSLTLIDNSVDPTTGTIVARASFPNTDELLWPGQLSDLTISLGTEPDLVVTPREAIQTGQNGAYVFTIVDGKAHVQPVEVGRQQGQEVVVLKGLNGDETVVVDGGLLLTEGALVNAREAAKGGA